MKTHKVLVGVPSVDVFINEWLPELKQADRINIEDARIWHAEMSVRETDRFAWHFMQLGRLCSSEIGEIAQRSMGYAATHTEVEHIIDRKLMRSLPERTNIYERRRFLAESMTSSIFKQDFGATSQRGIIKEIGKHYHGWMSGVVDDIVEINGAVGVVTYMATTDVPDKVYLIDQAKLQYFDFLLADSRNISHIPFYELEQRTRPLVFDFMLYVFLDYPNGITKPISVPYDGKLMVAMIEAGDYVWQHITQADPLPEWPVINALPTDIALNNEQKSVLAASELKIIKINSAIEVLKTHLNEATGEVEFLLKQASGSNTLKNIKLPLSATVMKIEEVVDMDGWQQILNSMEDEKRADAIEFTARRSAIIDESKVLNILEACDPDINKESLYKTEVNADLVRKYCIKNNIAPPIKESTVIANGMSDDAKVMIKSVTDNIESEVKIFVDQLNDCAKKIGNDVIDKDKNDL